MYFDVESFFDSFVKHEIVEFNKPLTGLSDSDKNISDFCQITLYMYYLPMNKVYLLIIDLIIDYIF